MKYTGSSLIPSSRLELSGRLSPHGTFLIEDDREILGVGADLSTNSTVMDFNGDDKVMLQSGERIIDAIGIVGDSLDFGKDITLRRKSEVQSPNSEFNREEWDIYGLEQIDDLNRHQSYCKGPVPEIGVYGLGLEIPDGKTGTHTDDNTYFGSLETGSSEFVDHEFVVKNTGTTQLEIETIHIEGIHRSDYRLSFPVSPLIMAGDSLIMRVRFSPGGSGVRNAFLVIKNNDPSEESYQFLLQGEGTNYTGGPLMITTYYEGESNDRWLEVTNVSGRDIGENSFYLALYRQDLLNAPINARPSVKKAIPSMAAGTTLTFRASLNGSKPNYALNGSEIKTGVCSFNGDDVIVISSADDESCWENRIDLVGRRGDWGSDVAYVRKYGCQQQGPHSGFIPDQWLPYATQEIDAAQPGVSIRLGEYYLGQTQFMSNSWTNGLPDLNRNAVILEDFSAATHGDLTACNLVIEQEAELTVEEGHHVAILNDLEVRGTLELMPGGELLMINNSGKVKNDGQILIRGVSSELNPYDYTYWSSPVNSADLNAVFRETDTRSIYSFSTTLFKDRDLDGEDDEGDAWVLASGAMVPGRGYAVMAPDILPVDGRQRVTFRGDVNNGFINVPVQIQGTSDSLGDWNLLGNPYPSAIDTERILADPGNANLLEGTFYFWTHNTPLFNDPDSGNDIYASDDYAMYTVGSGGIRASSGGVAPDRFIAPGQGFFVEARSEGTLRLSNEMRSVGNSPHFFKTPRNTKTEGQGKVWLNLFNDRGAFSQVLIAFNNGATDDYDSLYDGRRFSSNNYVDFYSVLDSLRLAIRGEPALRGEKELPLGIEVKSEKMISLTIGIDRISGSLKQTEIHLVDHVKSVRHDLRKEAYTFDVGQADSFPEKQKGQKRVSNKRFTLVFGGWPLEESVTEDRADAIIWFRDGDELRIRTVQNDAIERIRIFDLLGRVVVDFPTRGTTSSIPAHRFASNAVYVLQVYLSSGQTLSTRILHLGP